MKPVGVLCECRGNLLAWLPTSGDCFVPRNDKEKKPVIANVSAAIFLTWLPTSRDCFVPRNDDLINDSLRTQNQ